MKNLTAVRIQSGLVAIALLSMLACSKKRESVQDAPRIENHSILKHLPDDLLGLMVWDLERDSYKQFKKTAWGSSNNTIFAGFAGNDANSSFDALNTTVRDEKFWNAVNQHVAVVAGSLHFVPEELDMSFALVVEGKSKGSIASLVTLMKSEMESERFSFSKEGVISRATHPGKKVEFFYSQKDSTLFLSPQLSILNKMLDESDMQKGIGKLAATDAYTLSVSKLPARENEYFMGYVHLEGIFPLLPPGALRSLPMPVGDIPLRSAALNRSLRDGPLDSIAISIDEKKGSLQSSLSKLAAGGNQAALEVLPAQAVAGIGLDASLLKSTVKSVAALPQAQTAMAGLNPDILDGLISLAIGFEDVAPGALFPSLCISFSVAPGSNFGTELKKIADGQLKSNTGMQMTWQKKQVEGIEAQYILTPLGIGLYLAETPGRVLLASSEPALQKMLVAQKTGKGYLEELPPGLKTMLDTDPLLHLTVSFPAVATTIRNLSGSLAMFTGGQTLYEEKHLEALETFGLLGVSVSYKDQTFLIHNHYTQAIKK